MSIPITIFEQNEVVTDMKVHATAINKGFVVTMIAHLEPEEGEEYGDVVWAGNIFRPVAEMSEVGDMISELSETFTLWQSAVAAAS